MLLLLGWACGRVFLHSLPGHLFGFAASLAFPLGKQLWVGLGDAVGICDSEFLGCLVNPLGLPFDLGDVADGSFIYYDIALAVGPFGAELFISECWLQADRFEN